MQVMEELIINTEIGQLTAVFECHPLNAWTNAYTAWIKEKPSVVVQARSINEAIDELHTSLKVILEFENEK